MAKGAILTMGMVGAAHADRWTGFYAGANVGAVFNDTQVKSQQLGFTSPNETCNVSSDVASFSPGIQLGYMYQFPNDVVSGIEANIGFNTNQKHTLNCSSEFNPNVYDRFTFKNQLQTAIKGRVGYALSNLLPYLTAGASFANVGLTYKNEGSDYYSNTNTKAGWLIGAGIEWPFMAHWSLRAEYYYVGYGNAINLKIPSIYGLEDPDGNARVNLSANNVVVAINYWI